jgi:peptide/nickel transport system ATP-binding protein
VFFVLFVLAAAPGLAWVALGLLNIPLSIPRHYRMWRARDEHQAKTDEKVAEVLDAVGISAAEAADRKPHEFSGGQAQRISIARALILEPKVIICDEPVSALDVSVQAQILNLLQDMKQRYGLTLVFIAHDLAVVKNVSDRVAVMYLGKLCEVADPDTLYAEPAHPYTVALLSAIPEPDPTKHVDTVAGVGGELPSPIDPPSGCRFRTRCPRAKEVCANEEPMMHRAAENHYVACHFPVAPGEPVAPSDEDLASLAPARG